MTKKLVWIGAGSATNPKINFDDFNSIVLVDARKDACDELNQQFKDNVKIRTRQVCVSDVTGESKFFLCNVAELSALAEPTGLKTLYPGLQVESLSNIETLNIVDLIKEELVDGTIELFIDIPATACKLVRALSKSKLLEKILRVHISIGTAHALYKGSNDLKELSSLLKVYYFEEIVRDANDPDIPVVTFKLNESLKILERLTSENCKLQDQLIVAKQHSEKAELAASELSSELSEKKKLIEAKDIEIKALNIEIAEFKLDYQKKISDCEELGKNLDLNNSSILVLKNELSEERSKVAMLTKECDKQENKLRSSIQNLEQSKESERQKAEELNDTKAHLTELKGVLAATTEKLNIATENIALAKKTELEKNEELSKFEAKLNGLRQKIEEANAINLNLSKSIDIGSKQNLKLQTDLNDLRKHFSANQENEARLKYLIGELYENLSKAVNFYGRIKNSNSESLGHRDD